MAKLLEGRGRGTMHILRLLLCLSLLLGACTDAEPDDSGAEQSEGSAVADVPEVPVPTEPVRPTPAAPMGDVDELPEASPPTPGSTVLIHLEGPVTNREATDVVVRDDAGVEIDRFRLPGAIGIWASPGSSYALLYTLPGGWARYDAVGQTLSLLTFPGDPPGPTIRPGGGLAGPTALWNTLDARWLARLDTGVIVDLQATLPDATVLELSRNGGVALLDSPDGLSLLQTRTGELTDLDVNRAGISEDGLRLATSSATTTDDGEAVQEIAVAATDGTTRQVLGVTTQAGTPIPLDDGRVLILGATPTIIDQQGEVTAFSPSFALQGAIRTSATGVALATTPSGLAVVDTTALTITPISGSAGFSPLMIGPTTQLWAITIDPQAPGGLVVDPGTGQVTRFLDDVPTESVGSISAEGTRVGVRVGGSDGMTSVLVDADGTIMPVQESLERVEVSLHPGGEVVALNAVSGPDRSLLVGRIGEDLQVIDTGRNAVWLSTIGPVTRPGT